MSVLKDPGLQSLASAHPRQVALALSEYRKRNKMTLQAISDITGVSVGTLSKLENEKGTPSFRTLTRIIQLVDLSSGARPMAKKISAGSSRKTVTLQDQELVAKSDRAIMYIHSAELLKKEMFPMLAQVTLHEVPPIDVWAQHEGEEFIYVVSGVVEVHMEHYRSYKLCAGESTYYDSGMRHVIVSTGEHDAMVLSVSTSQVEGASTWIKPT